jgi:hypothetical protein
VSQQRRVVEIAEEVLGVKFTVEHGGQGCHVARLEGGAVFTISDGLAGTDYEGSGYVVAAL